MEWYRIDRQLTKVEPQAGLPPADGMAAALLFDELAASEEFGEFAALLHKGEAEARLRFCKVEQHPDLLWGTVSVPVKNKYPERKSFAYLLQPGRILLLDNAGFASALLRRVAATKSWKEPCVEWVFYALLDELVEDDLLYLEELENRIAKMETAVLNGELGEINNKIIAFRKELLAYERYYGQMADMAENLQENENGLLASRHMRLFKLLAGRLYRYQSSIRMLREYIVQIREAYQSQIDIRQNKIMKILTVVTSVFMPLTLITGWYGMNFTNMPELTWKYGYLVVILVSVLVVAFCIWLIKRNKLW